MARRFCNYGKRFFYLLAPVLGVLVSGCSPLIGPQSLSVGRMDYSEAINQTENQQLLLSVVKGRYGEMVTPLAVSGIAANVRFRSNANIEAGFGPEDYFTGNLVPFSGGVAYEENPTITYMPVRNEQYVRRLISPIPLDVTMLMLRSYDHKATVLRWLVSSINDLRNPDFLYDPSSETIAGFERFTEIYEQLARTHVLNIVKSDGEDAEFEIVLRNYRPDHEDTVGEFLSLLDLDTPTAREGIISIPLSFSIRTKAYWGIGLTTRSTSDLVEILRASIEVPPEHAALGLAADYPPTGLAGTDVTIRSSAARPEHASVAVRYRDYWFSIDDSDHPSKGFFNLLRTFLSSTIADAADHAGAPVLTIPVSR